MKLKRFIDNWRNVDRINGMAIIRNRIIPFSGYKAIFLFGVLFAKPNAKLDELTINHESIHAKQYKELLTVGIILFTILQSIFWLSFWYAILLFLTVGVSLYYILYVLEWIVRGFDYRNISFEQEAYTWQGTPKKRKKFAFIK